MALAYDPLFITSDKSPIDITSRTQSENHTTRPNALFNRFVVYCVVLFIQSPRLLAIVIVDKFSSEIVNWAIKVRD